MSKQGKDQTVGHRQRIRDRFLAGEGSSKSDEALLELLLTYAIPQKDVKPLAKQLLVTFGSLSAVLAADVKALSQVSGIKENTAILLKLVDRIRVHRASAEQITEIARETPQASLFDFAAKVDSAPKPKSTADAPTRRTVMPRRGTGLFGKAVLEEAIDLLPRLPNTESLDAISEFLRKNLHYSAQASRRRFGAYVVRRMFPEGYADPALRNFAKHFAGRQELGDAAFYRFCNAEPLMFDVIEQLMLPAIGIGTIPRDHLRHYLTKRFPGSKSIQDCLQAIIEALDEGGIAKKEHTKITFAYRDILIPSFAFILHSEFPEPGMYDLAKLENNRAIRAMLWNPDRVLPTVYELRNLGLISKVSEIDSVRQFTTRYTLPQVVEQLARKGEPG